ncbi:oligosaccharide flippase family protein [Intrasporangium sp.]|uniref:oligosaccharide flippase family protein n=1 Tax=Intrasporangium sp. TaxID=1925024 RepID=UPI00293B0A2D|nr:oligosaccharide flippase family protein [Intrasporangium sp.]MDV3221956.1 oligosaccharide flippase family protein [Intrasporangium sp.]
MAQRMAHDAPAANRYARSGAALLVGTLASNALSYLFFVVLSRVLTSADLGGVGAMVNLSVIASVPALGMQLVAARLVARRRGDEARSRELERRMLEASLLLGVVLALVVSAISPVLAPTLEVTVLTVVLLAAALVPLTVLHGAQGLLQGRERFAALALVLTLAGLGKVLAAFLAGTHMGGITPVATVILLYGLALVVVAALGALLVRRAPRRTTPSDGSPSTRPRPRGGTGRLVRLVAAAVVPTSGLLFLASVDVLLARHHLSPAESGQYTVGALFEKAAFWGMSFLATLFYPAMVDAPRRRAALLRALALVSGLGAAGVAMTVVLGEPLLQVVGGPQFTVIAPDLWRFTAFGVALSLVQILAYAGVAAATVRMGLAMWLVSGLAVAWVSLAGRTTVDIVTILLACAVVLVLAGLAIERETLRGAPDTPEAPDMPDTPGTPGTPDRDGAPQLSAPRRARSGRPRC